MSDIPLHAPIVVPPAQHNRSARWLVLLFIFTVISFMALIVVVLQVFTNSVTSKSGVQVLSSDTRITTPNDVTLGVAFNYSFDGHKLLAAAGTTRRQISCMNPKNNIGDLESIDTISPQTNVGVIHTIRQMTIPTYKQNLKDGYKCRLDFEIDYTFYSVNGITRQIQSIPISQHIVSNWFTLHVDPNIQQSSPMTISIANGSIMASSL